MRIAIIENSLVTNVIEGELEAVKALFPEVALETEATNPAWIGARWNGRKFEAQNSFQSWTWNEDTFDYDPPIPKPDGDYYWSEAELNWLPIPVQLDSETGLPIIESELTLVEEPSPQSAQESATAKLSALGLTPEEIAAITGA